MSLAEGSELSSGIEEFRMAAWEKCKLNLDQFRAAVRMDAFRQITLRAGGVHFTIDAQPRTQPGIDSQVRLVTSRSRRDRQFRDPATALGLLWAIGARTVTVDLNGWHPDQAKLWCSKRPDMAERLRFAHEHARQPEGVD